VGWWARFEPIDPDFLLGLEPLGLRATGQRPLLSRSRSGALSWSLRPAPVIAPVDERLFCVACRA